MLPTDYKNPPRLPTSFHHSYLLFFLSFLPYLIPSHSHYPHNLSLRRFLISLIILSHSHALKQLSSFILYVVLSSSSLIIFIIPTMTQSTFSFFPSFYQRPPSFLYNFHPFNIITQLASSFSHYFSLSSFSLVIFAPFSCHHATAILVFSPFFILILSHHPQRGIMCRETQFEKLKILFPPHGKARHQKLFPGQCRPKLFTLKYIPSMTKCISSVYLFSVYL